MMYTPDRGRVPSSFETENGRWKSCIIMKKYTFKYKIQYDDIMLLSDAASGEGVGVGVEEIYWCE